MTELDKLTYIIYGIKLEIKEMCYCIGNEKLIRHRNFDSLKELLTHLEEAENDLKAFAESDKDDQSENALE